MVFLINGAEKMDIHMQKNKLGLLPQIICIHTYIPIVCASLVAQTVKNLPAIWETWTQSLGQEDPLEKGMATHSSILAWRSPWTEEPVDYSPWGRKELDTTEWVQYTHTCTKIHSKWIKDLNVKVKTIKLVGGNMGINLCDLGLGNGFLNMTP